MLAEFIVERSEVHPQGVGDEETKGGSLKLTDHPELKVGAMAWS